MPLRLIIECKRYLVVTCTVEFKVMGNRRTSKLGVRNLCAPLFKVRVVRYMPNALKNSTCDWNSSCLYLFQLSFRPQFSHHPIMSRRYDSRVDYRFLVLRLDSITNLRAADNNFLPRRTTLPSWVCARSNLTCWHGDWNPLERWYRFSCRKKGYEQAPWARHLSRETIHPQWVHS